MHAEPYFEFADLIVEDIPISAVRNPPEHLKQFAIANNKSSAKVPMPTYVGSNTQFLSIPMIQFNLRGQGNSCQAIVSPPISIFEGDTFINQTYLQSVSLIKQTQGTINYKLSMTSKSKDSLQVTLKDKDGKSLSSCGEILEGVILDEGLANFEIEIESSECGPVEALFYVEIEDGSPLAFSVKADFRGPIVRLLDSVVDFGLAKVNTSHTRTITIENECPVSATLIIKDFKNKKLTFTNALMDEAQIEVNNSESRLSQGSLVVGRPVKTRAGNSIKIDNCALELAPKQKLQISFDLDCLKPESVEEYFEIMVKDAKSLFV